ncbi:hypothetical protein AVEN_206157-1 [Araneus ventricosus]|uniref:Uncharacterized protein n=1 Tax=Araneus ventricosus TaxID=182803 RepID=A0A4Y2N644_ARAVE|nr:hypothetical protein AVEN_206157-1 [Araneus ventricosus]
MTPSLNKPGRLCQITSRGPNDYFLFPKLKEHLSGTRVSPESDVKTPRLNWLNRQDVISAKPGETSDADLTKNVDATGESSVCSLVHRDRVRYLSETSDGLRPLAYGELYLFP